MASARYWRLAGFTTPGDLELAGVQLYHAGARVDAMASLSPTIAPSAGVVANLQDPDLASTCRFAAATVRASGFALVWDFGAATQVSAVRLASTLRAVWPTAFELQYFDDVRWQPLAALGKVIYPGDSQWSVPILQVAGGLVALFNFDGPNGSTTLTDESPSPATQYASGITISTAKSKFGGASAYFGTGAGSLKLGDASDPQFAPGRQDFAFEAWVYDMGAGNRRVLAGNAHSSGSGGSLTLCFLNQTVPVSTVVASGTSYTVQANRASPVNQWFLFGLYRNGTDLKMRIDGVSAGSVTLPAGASIAAGDGRFAVGTTGDYSIAGGPYGVNWIGYVDSWRFVIGDAVQTADFTPYDGPFDNSFSGSQSGLEAMPIRTWPQRARTAFSAPVPAASVRGQGASLMARDNEFGGPGTITGQTLVKDGGPEVPTRARVVLLRARDKLVAREMWSDPVTGAYSFAGLDTDQQFIALAQKPDGAYEPVAGGPLTPKVP